MESVLYVVPGLVVALGAYFVYLAATKGLPAAVTWFKAWWNKGKAELSTLKGDVTEAQAKLTSMEATLGADVAKLKTDVAALQAKVP